MNLTKYCFIGTVAFLAVYVGHAFKGYGDDRSTMGENDLKIVIDLKSRVKEITGFQTKAKHILKSILKNDFNMSGKMRGEQEFKMRQPITEGHVNILSISKRIKRSLLAFGSRVKRMCVFKKTQAYGRRKRACRDFNDIIDNGGGGGGGGGESGSGDLVKTFDPSSFITTKSAILETLKTTKQMREISFTVSTSRSGYPSRTNIFQTKNDNERELSLSLSSRGASASLSSRRQIMTTRVTPPSITTEPVVSTRLNKEGEVSSFFTPQTPETITYSNFRLKSETTPPGSTENTWFLNTTTKSCYSASSSPTKNYQTSLSQSETEMTSKLDTITLPSPTVNTTTKSSYSASSSSTRNYQTSLSQAETEMTSKLDTTTLPSPTLNAATKSSSSSFSSTRNYETSLSQSVNELLTYKRNLFTSFSPVPVKDFSVPITAQPTETKISAKSSVELKITTAESTKSREKFSKFQTTIHGLITTVTVTIPKSGALFSPVASKTFSQASAIATTVKSSSSKLTTLFTTPTNTIQKSDTVLPREIATFKTIKAASIPIRSMTPMSNKISHPFKMSTNDLCSEPVSSTSGGDKKVTGNLAMDITTTSAYLSVTSAASKSKITLVSVPALSLLLLENEYLRRLILV